MKNIQKYSNTTTTTTTTKSDKTVWTGSKALY